MSMPPRRGSSRHRHKTRIRRRRRPDVRVAPTWRQTGAGGKKTVRRNIKVRGTRTVKRGPYDHKPPPRFGTGLPPCRAGRKVITVIGHSKPFWNALQSKVRTILCGSASYCQMNSRSSTVPGIERTVSSNPERTFDGPPGIGRFVPLLVLAAALVVVLLLPLKIIGFGFLPRMTPGRRGQSDYRQTVAGNSRAQE